MIKIVNSALSIDYIDDTDGKLLCREYNADSILNGITFWYDKEGKYHRLDGPAIEGNGPHIWYYHGEPVKCSTQQEFERMIRLKVFW